MTLAPHVVVNLGLHRRLHERRLRRGGRGHAQASSTLRPRSGRWVLVDLLPRLPRRPGGLALRERPVLVRIQPARPRGRGSCPHHTARRGGGSHPGSLRASAPVALVTAAYAVPVLALVYVGRLAQVEDIRAADDLRLLPDVSAAVAIALAALVGAVLDRRLPGGPGGWGLRARRAAAVGAGTAVVLCTVTWVGFGLRWHDTPVTGFVATMRSDVTTTSRWWCRRRSRPRSSPVGSTRPSPPHRWCGYSTRTRFRATSTALSRWWARPARWFRQTSPGSPTPRSPRGSAALVVPVGVRSVTLPLKESAPYYRGSRVMLGVIVGDAERLNISVTGRDGTTWGPLVEDPPELLRGPHRIHALVPYGVAVESIT